MSLYIYFDFALPLESKWIQKYCFCTEKEELVSECLSNQFTCSSDQKCVPFRKICNGHKDCADGSDELMCETSKYFNSIRRIALNVKFSLLEQCKDTEMLCKNLCLPRQWICDGYADCEDGADEAKCPGIKRLRYGNEILFICLFFQAIQHGKKPNVLWDTNYSSENAY